MGVALATKRVLVTVEKEQGNAFHFPIKRLLTMQLYITNKTERFSFKSGRAVRVTCMPKRLRQTGL